MNLALMIILILTPAVIGVLLLAVLRITRDDLIRPSRVHSGDSRGDDTGFDASAQRWGHLRDLRRDE